MVNVVGDQATYHRQYDAPLTSDIEGWARGGSGWVRTRDAVPRTSGLTPRTRCRRRGPRRADRDADPARRHVLGRGRRGRRARCPCRRRRRPTDAARSRRRAPCCARASRTLLILLGGRRAAPRPLAAAQRIAAATGARLMAQFSNARDRARPRPRADRARALSRAARRSKRSAGVAHLMLVGARDAGRLLRLSRQARPAASAGAPMCTCWRGRSRTSPHALRCSPDALGAPAVAAAGQARAGAGARRAHPGVGRAIARRAAARERDRRRRERQLRPRPSAATRSAPRRTTGSTITGGAIGDGLPLATGAAVGAPGPARGLLRGDGGGDVHDPVAVDAGARAAGRHDGHLRPTANTRSCSASSPMSAPIPAAPRST